MTSEMDRANQLELAKRVVLNLTSPKGLAEMRRLMQETARGPSSANLDARGGDRYDVVNIGTPDEFSARVPSDPTGEAALRPDAAQEALALTERLLRDLYVTAVGLSRLYDSWSPLGMRDVDHKDGFTDDWCRSCWRNDRTCTPITKRGNGRPYYVGLCKHCGELRTALGMRRTQMPPLELVMLRHAGQPITKRVVAEWTMAKKTRKRSKGKKAA